MVKYTIPLAVTLLPHLMNPYTLVVSHTFDKIISLTTVTE